MTVRVKICCIAGTAEARMAVAAGAAAVGLVSAMPSGPGVISEEEICRVAATIPPGVASFLLTSLQEPDAIVAQQRLCRATTLQLVDDLPAGALRHLRGELPRIGLVQVIHVAGGEAVDEALAVAPEVDAILLDSGNRSLPVKELGGTGRVHDWTISRRVVDAVRPLPVYLAGGLNPGNVREAIETVQPFAVDVCSGVRTDGRLDPFKLDAFLKAATGRG